mgnify:CR=1 FL=1
MFKRLFTVLLFLASLCYTSNAQSLITGKVFDTGNASPLPGVHIKYNSNRGVLSDNKGEFSFNPGQGLIKIVFTFVGYGTLVKEVNVAANDTVYFEIGLIEDVTNINEVVVSAGRKEQKISDLSVSMEVLKPYEIARYHIINAEELLHKTSGIEIMDGQVSIRGGSGYSYGAGSRVITLIDGLPALSTDAGNVKWGTLPIENISRIEVIKGASSVLYGSSALNGVINFITRDASSEPLTRLSVSSGIYDNPSRKEWKWWDSPRMIHNLSFSHSELYGNTEIGVGLRAMSNNGYRKLNDDNNLRFSFNIKHKSSKNEALLFGMSVYASYNAKNDFLLWDNADDGALIQSESTAMDYRGLSLAVDPFISFRGKKGGKHEIKSRVLSNLNRLPDNTNNNSDSHSAYLEYQYSYSISNKISVVAGLLEQYSVIKSNFYGDHSGLNLAAYAQFDFAFSDRISAVSGFRIEKYMLDGIAEDPVPIVRAGVNYKACEKTFLRASFGQGYRYPSIAEKHAFTTVGAIKIFPNQDIKSEKGWSAELGIKQAFDKGLLNAWLDIALFYSQNRDMIEYVFGNYPDPASGEYQLGFRPVNIENSRVYGLEAEVFINRKFGSFNTSLSTGYTYMYPVEYNSYSNRSTGEYLKYRRKHSLNFAVNTLFRKVEAGLTLYYKSKILEIDDVFLNELTRETILPGFFDYWKSSNRGYFLADLNAGYRFNNSKQLTFTIKNFTNTEYMGRPGDIQPQRYYSVMFTSVF